ncbi:ROK family protein [Azorhizobium doebereinerae]|uniref:ROK family protein n=1 Tax=Azorhizobium doebereinerae TaxID=281091 RepID=UPI000A025EB7|nr:ROK family protein [Azorhizobium doebereinerae]
MDNRHGEAPIYGGVDAGGTKFICAIGTLDRDIRAIESIPTSSPKTTLLAVAKFFNKWEQRSGLRLSGIGVSSFGPLIRDPRDPDYGSLRNSPKPGWRTAAIGSYLQEKVNLQRTIGLPVSIDTDVNGAALAEREWGAARGIETFAYVTIGTGIGVGIVSGSETIRGTEYGRLLNGVGHPELGHYRPGKDPEHGEYQGCCPYHSDCLEGLASGAAIRDWTGKDARELSDDHLVWNLVARYLGHLCTVLILTLAPQRIVLGGGVMARRPLLAKICEATEKNLNGYHTHPLFQQRLHDVIVPSSLSPAIGINGGPCANAGVLGGFLLARRAASAWA